MELEKKDVGAVLEGEALAIEGPELRAADEWLASLVGYVESSRVTVDPLADLVHHYWYSQVLVRCLRNMDYNLLMVVAGPCKSIGRDILECLEGSCSGIRPALFVPEVVLPWRWTDLMFVLNCSSLTSASLYSLAYGCSYTYQWSHLDSAGSKEAV